MTYGSLFSGAGGIDLGFDRAGLTPLWQCEIDPTARAVLNRHWPDVPTHEDVRQVGRKNLAKVDLICGGFPCQDLSVAGKRAGIQGGTRSGLFYEFTRIVRELKPKYMVWENVPGLLSSDGGRDFARVVRELADSGYFGCYRTLDAQFFGVPQRRRRVFGVFARGHSGAERCCEILALTESVRRDHPTRGQAGKDVAGCLGGGSGNRGWSDDTDRMTFVADSLEASQGRRNGMPSGGERAGHLVPTAIRTANTSSNGCGLGHDTLDSANGQAVGLASGVRRLTPRECERLMGWPDDHTRYRADGSEIADGPRYRLAGNGVVANVAEWIARQIIETEQLKRTTVLQHTAEKAK